MPRRWCSRCGVEYDGVSVHGPGSCAPADGREARLLSAVEIAEARDPFLRNVVESLVDDNTRWPGLWTRLESLLAERDALAADLAAAQADLYATEQNRDMWRQNKEALGEMVVSLRADLSAALAREDDERTAHEATATRLAEALAREDALREALEWATDMLAAAIGDGPATEADIAFFRKLHALASGEPA